MTGDRRPSVVINAATSQPGKMARSGRKNKRASFQNCCATLEPRRHATDGITHHAEACRAETWAAGASSMRLELVLMVYRLWEVTRSTHHFSRGANTRRRATNGHGNESRAVTASRTAPPFRLFLAPRGPTTITSRHKSMGERQECGGKDGPHGCRDAPRTRQSRRRRRVDPGTRPLVDRGAPVPSWSMAWCYKVDDDGAKHLL